MVSPVIIAFCLLCLMDVIVYIPSSCLAAIVIVNLVSLFKNVHLAMSSH